MAVELEACGDTHKRLITGERPLAHKYHEGKMKRTLKRELKVPEIVEREANGTSHSWLDWRERMRFLLVLPQGTRLVFQMLFLVFLALCVSISFSLRKTQASW